MPAHQTPQCAVYLTPIPHITAPAYTTTCLVMYVWIIAQYVTAGRIACMVRMKWIAHARKFIAENVSSVHLSCISTALWQYFNCISTALWQYFNCMLTALCQYFSCNSTALWQYFSCILTALWQYLSCISTTLWQYFNCVSTAFYSISTAFRMFYGNYMQ